MRDVLQASESKDTGNKFSARLWLGSPYDERKAPMMRIYKRLPQHVAANLAF